MEYIELTNSEIMTINGGISTKSLIIGGAMTAVNPIMGAGYWFRYFINC